MTDNSLFDLTGKTALITGAGSGIGARMAYALAMAGASTILLGRRPESLATTAETLAGAGLPTARILPADLCAISDFRAFVAESELAGVDILCNVAGVNLRQHADHVTPEGWDRTLDLNLKIPFFLAQALVSGMKRRGWGRIINIGSLQTVRAFPNGIAYGASKGAVPQLTRAMAEAWSAHGINANAIAPGFFPTALTRPVYDDAALVARNAAQTAIGRNGEMGDLDGVTVFFASRASDYVTGQTLYLDGGFTAK
jgi:NAD(P)-dependent dehydrogenase (short-subunit alcohol dehydrogenase family)